MWWFLKKLCGEANEIHKGCGHIAKLARNIERSNIKEELQKAMQDNTSFRTELFSLWNNNSDIMYGAVFIVSHFANHASSTLEMTVYSKYGYKVSQAMLVFKSVDELFEWFYKKDTPEKCSQTLTELYEIAKHPD